MKKTVLRLVMTLGLSVLFLSGALRLLGASGGAPVVQAQAGSGVIRVAPSGSDGVGCGAADVPCQTIQYAIDQAQAGDEIWVASQDVSGSLFPPNIITTTARYTGNGVNIIELTRSLTLRGGYVYYHVGLANQWIAGFVPAPVDGENVRRGLCVTGDTTPTVQYLAFVNGQAERGGNVYVEDAAPTLHVTPILSGHADYGGGLYVKNSRMSIAPGDADVQNLLNLSGFLSVQNNTARYAGGGVYVEGGAPVLSLLYVYSNTAANGGGFYLDGGYPVIAGGLVRENSATDAGGAFYLVDSAARVAAMAVYSNAATQGAGFYLDGPFGFSSETVPIIANNYVRYNSVGGSFGGGFYFHEAVAGLVNNVIADNSAGQGGGMYLYASSPQVFHNTIAQNMGGSGVYLTCKPGSLWPPVPPIPSYPSFTNTIVVSHNVGLYVDSTGLPAPLQNKATLDGTLWWGNGSDTGGSGDVVQAHTVYTDPQFECTGMFPDCLRPYHLITDSNAVDAGVEVALTLPGTDLLLDIDGQLRPSGDGYDIGADEVVTRAYSVWLIPSLSILPATPGEIVTHTHRLLNAGLQTDTYDLAADSNLGWGALVGSAVITLSPQASQTVQVRVQVPIAATAQQTDSTVISATSRADPNNRAGAVDLTRVITAATADLALALDAQPLSLPPAGDVTYHYTVTNNGPYFGTVPTTLTAALVPTRALGSWHLPAGCTGAMPRGLVTCTVALPSGTLPVVQYLTMAVTASDTYSGQLFNLSAVRVGDDLIDPAPANNVAQQVVYVSPSNVPVDAVTLRGPATGTVGLAMSFTATVSPLTATLPITYVWQALERMPYSHTVSSYDDSHSFTWTLTGTKVVTVTAIGAGGGSETAAHTITVVGGGGGTFFVYLPLVLRN